MKMPLQIKISFKNNNIKGRTTNLNTSGRLKVCMIIKYIRFSRFSIANLKSFYMESKIDLKLKLKLKNIIIHL